MGTFFIVYVAPEIAHKCGLEEYKTPTSYTEFTQYEAVKMKIDIQEFVQSPRETELIAPKTSDLGSKFNLWLITVIVYFLVTNIIYSRTMGNAPDRTIEKDFMLQTEAYMADFALK